MYLLSRRGSLEFDLLLFVLIDLELLGYQFCLDEVLLEVSLMLQSLELLVVPASYLLLLLLLGLKPALHFLLLQVLEVIF